MKQRKLFSILFRVVFVLLKVYGFLPLKYDFRRNRFESCRVSLCYCLVLMLVYGVGMFYVYRNIIDNTVHESSLNNLFMKMQFGLNYFFFMLTISVAIVGRNLVKYLLNILIFLTNIILARSIKLVDNKLLTHILFKLVFVDIFIQIFIIISYSKYDTDSWKFSIKSTLNFTFMWSTAVLSNGYVAICYLIAHLYRQINLQIADLVQKLCNFGSDHSHWSLKSTKKKQLFRQIATELDRLAYLHRDVTTVVQWFVKIFDFSLLVMIVWDFFIVMFAVRQTPVRKLKFSNSIQKPPSDLLHVHLPRPGHPGQRAAPLVQVRPVVQRCHLSGVPVLLHRVGFRAVDAPGGKNRPGAEPVLSSGSHRAGREGGTDKWGF